MLLASPEHPRHPLDPGLLVVHVAEELVQAVALVELGAAGAGHALDALEAPVDGLALVLHLGRVEGAAGHQTVSLAVQVLQAVLDTEGREQGLLTARFCALYVRMKIRIRLAVTGFVKNHILTRL